MGAANKPRLAKSARRLGALPGAFAYRGGKLLGRVVEAASTGLLGALAAFSESVREGVQAERASRSKVGKRNELTKLADAAGVPVEWAEQLELSHPGALREAALSKAESLPNGAKLNDWQAFEEDPLDITQAYGAWRERAGLLTYETLDLMAQRISPVSAIIQTRINQVAGFARPQENPHELGYRVTLRDRDGKPSKADQKRMTELEEAVLNCGFTERYDEDEGRMRDGFEAFLRKITRDRLTYDQINVELRRDIKRRPVEWRAVDAKTIRHVIRDWRGENAWGEPIRYAQTIGGAVVADFSPLDLGFHIANPRTDIRAYHYGLSELEMMVTTATALLNGFDHNARYFGQGTTAKGLLAVRGIVPPRHLRAFQRLWYAMVTGAMNAWRTPILNVTDEKGDVKWIDLQKSNLDMEWSKFMDWCLKISCAIFLIAPEEINFQFGNAGQRAALKEGGQQEKFDFSKDKGLKPLLRFIEGIVNEDVIWRIDPKYEFQFVGLDSRSQQEEAELATKEANTFRTVDEIRADKDLPPLPDGTGAAILNPTWLQFYSQKQMAAQQEQQGPPGAPQADDQGLVGPLNGEGGEAMPQQQQWTDNQGLAGQQTEQAGQEFQPMARSETSGRGLAKSRPARVTYTVDL